MYHRTMRPWHDNSWLQQPVDVQRNSVTVAEQDPDTFSGLYDAHGNKLHKQQNKMGFIK